MTRVELKTFTSSSASNSLSIDNAVSGPVPKRLLFTMVKNAELDMAVSSREAVIDYEFLRGRQNETVVKELCVASAIASETFGLNRPTRWLITDP